LSQGEDFARTHLLVERKNRRAVSNLAILFVFDLSVVNLHHLIAPHIITKFLA
jgi:hypothetical protein